MVLEELEKQIAEKREKRLLQQENDQMDRLFSALSGEKLRCVTMDAPTAFFDLKRRVIVLPTWPNMDRNVRMMLRAHETAHALFTPWEGWHDEIKYKYPRHGGYYNVLEDARIERLMQRRFPGLKPYFVAAYDKIFHDKFFGTTDEKQINSLSLIDRINIHCKAGAHVNVRFYSDEERDFLQRAETTTRWKEVAQLARDIIEYEKEKARKKKSTTPEASTDPNDKDFKVGLPEEGEQDVVTQEPDYEEPEEDDQDDQDSGESEGEDGEGQDSDSQGNGEQDQDPDPGEDEEAEDGPGAGRDPYNDEAVKYQKAEEEEDDEEEEDIPESETDEAYRENERDMLEKGASSREEIDGKMLPGQAFILPTEDEIGDFIEKRDVKDMINSITL